MSTPLLYVLACVAACLAAFAAGRVRRDISSPDLPALVVVVLLGVASAATIWVTGRAGVAPRWRLTAAMVGGAVPAVVVAVVTQCAEGCLDVR